MVNQLVNENLILLEHSDEDAQKVFDEVFVVHHVGLHYSMQYEITLQYGGINDSL